MKKVLSFVFGGLVIFAWGINEGYKTEFVGQMVTENEGVVFVEDGSLFFWGEEGKLSPALVSALRPWWERSKVVLLNQLEIGQSLGGPHFTWQKLSSGVIKGSFYGTTFLLISANSDVSGALMQPVGVSVDWWVVTGGAVGMLPVPNQGIFFVSPRNPSKAWRELSESKKLPLISTKQAQGLRANFFSDELELWQRSSLTD
jgi:hypothetical protein